MIATGPFLVNSNQSHMNASAVNGPALEQEEPGAWLTCLVVGLSLLLLGLIIAMAMPLHLQNTLLCFLCNYENPDHTNNIDCGLHKTQLSIYRPDVYSAQLRRQKSVNDSVQSERVLLSSNSTEQAGTSAPPVTSEGHTSHHPNSISLDSDGETTPAKNTLLGGMRNALGARAPLLPQVTLECYDDDVDQPARCESIFQDFPEVNPGGAMRYSPLQRQIGCQRATSSEGVFSRSDTDLMPLPGSRCPQCRTDRERFLRITAGSSRSSISTHATASGCWSPKGGGYISRCSPRSLNTIRQSSVNSYGCPRSRQASMATWVAASRMNSSFS